MRKRNISLSIPIEYTRPLLEELTRLGGDLELLWRHAAIATPLSDVLDGCVAELPATEFTSAYRYSAGELERLCCIRDGRRPMGKNAVNILCHCLISCSTLRDAVDRAARFNTVMEERGGELGLHEQNGVARFTMHVSGRKRDSASLLVDLTGLYFYFQLFSWLIGYRLKLHEVGVVHSAPPRLYPLLDVFDVPLRYEQAENYLSFSVRHLEQRIVRSSEELKRIIDYFPFDLSLSKATDMVFSDQIHLLLLDALQHRKPVPALTTVAQLFHMSPATVRRRLSEEGVSYTELRASSQYEMAKYLLSQTEMPMGDIVECLGFGSDRAFRRAFREWCGETPAAFRGRQEEMTTLKE